MIDSSSFPRIYRPKAFSAYVVYPLFSLILWGGAALLLTRFNPPEHWIAAGFGTFMALLGIANFLQLLICKLVLYPDRIEWVSLLGNVKLDLSAIEGRGRPLDKFDRRGHPIDRSDAMAVLYPKDASKKKLYIPNYFKYDEDFRHWLTGLPDRDLKPDQATANQCANGVQQDATPQAKSAEIAGSQRRSRGVTLTTFALAAWAVLYPHPVWLVFPLILAAPWIAILLAAGSGGLYNVLESDSTQLKGVGNLFSILPLPIFALWRTASRHLGDLPEMPLEWRSLILPALIIGASMTALVVKVSKFPSVKFTPLLSVGLSLILYAGVATGLLNSLLDTHTPSNTELTVAGKHEIGGRAAIFILETVNRSDSPYDGPLQLPVSAHLYTQTAPQQMVCAHQYPGAFGLRWEKITACGS